MAKKNKLSDVSVETVPTTNIISQEAQMTEIKNIPAATEGVTTLDISKLDGLAVIKQDVLTVKGINVDVRWHQNGHVSFGSTKPTRERVILNNFFQARGFLNALGYVMDDKYAVLRSGFHGKTSMDDTRYNIQMDQFYVNMDILTDQEVAAFIAKWGLGAELSDKHDWNVLHIIKNKVVFGHNIKPLLNSKAHPEVRQACEAQIIKEEIEAGTRKADDKSIPEVPAEMFDRWVDNNEKAHDQVHLHEGIEFARDILTGERSVTIAMKPYFEAQKTESFDVQKAVIAGKIERLWKAGEVRQAAMGATIQSADNKRSTERGAWFIEKNVGGIGDAMNAVVAQGITVFVGGESKTVTVEEMVGASVKYVFEGDDMGYDFFRTVAAVKAAVRDALTAGKQIHVRKFAA